MSTTEKAPAFKPAINIPFRLTPKFVDVRPGKPWKDPATGQTKQLPAQVSIKGLYDGVETICFLPGAVWKNIKSLASAGIINEQDTDALEEVDKVTNIPLLAHEEFIATLAKPAGAKYADMTFTPATAERPTQPSKRLPPPESRTTKTAHRAGPDIPGMDEAMEDEPLYRMPQDDNAGMPEPMNAAAEREFQEWSASFDRVGQDGPEDARRFAEPPLIPREVREREAQAKGDGPVSKMVAQFADLYAETLGALVAVHQAAGSSTTVPHSRTTDLPALTTEAVYKVAVSLWIEGGKRGMFKC